MTISRPAFLLILAIVGVVCLCSLPLGVLAQENVSEALDPSLNEAVVKVPVDASGSVSLEVTIFTPPGYGPFPLAVLNHGKDKGDARDEKRYRSVYLARYFLSRGYAVILPMLRGFAGSDGELVPLKCDALHEGLQQARDIAAVIDWASRQPQVDGNRIVVAGQSYGGWNTLALGALDIPGIQGLVNFAGGRNAPACKSLAQDLATGAAFYAQKTRVPSIWFYGDNDGQFPIATWQGMYKSYTAAGGRAALIPYGIFMNDAHNLLGMVEGLSIWVPQLDAFLTAINLPHVAIYPQLLPPAYPPPTNFADIMDSRAVPFLSDHGRQQYQEFLNQPMPRVFVIAKDGSAISSHGGFDPLSHALALCAKYGRICKPYAIDNSVVW